MLQSSCPLSIVKANFPLNFTKNPYPKRQRNHCVDNGHWNSKFVKNSKKKFALLHLFLTSICKPLNYFFVPFLFICTLYAFFCRNLFTKVEMKMEMGGLKSLFNVNHYDIQFPLLDSSPTPLGSTLLETSTWIWAFWRIPKYNTKRFVIFVVMKEGVECAKNNGLFYHAF